MEFVQLSRFVLLVLRGYGYTVLYSVSPLSDENPVWYPEQVDIDELMELGNVELARRSIPLQELHFLIIQDALDNINEEDLIGQVFLEQQLLNIY